MTPEQMQEKSSMKVKQVMDMMALLNLRVEARQRVDRQGFIEMLTFWIDDEKYPAAPTGENGPVTEEDLDRALSNISEDLHAA